MTYLVSLSPPFLFLSRLSKRRQIQFLHRRPAASVSACWRRYSSSSILSALCFSGSPSSLFSLLSALVRRALVVFVPRARLTTAVKAWLDLVSRRGGCRSFIRRSRLLVAVRENRVSTLDLSLVSSLFLAVWKARLSGSAVRWCCSL